MSLKHDYLNTITIHTDWDLPLINRLIGDALLYCENGFWEGLQETALAMLEIAEEDKPQFKPLKQAFNQWLAAKQELEFDEDSEEAYEVFAQSEQTLATELLEYHADRDAFVIVHALDEDHYDYAWFLCFYDDVRDLDNAIHA